MLGLELFRCEWSKRLKSLTEALMDELSIFGIGFAVAILTLACLMAAKLSSRKAYH
jgi:hypothetical protein